MTRLKRLWQDAPWPTAILALSLLIATFFAVRFIAYCVYWNDPTHHTQKVEGWMTPGYISHSWNMPRRELLDAIHAPLVPEDGKPHTLTQLADMMDMPETELIDMAQDAVSTYTAHERDTHD